MSSLLILSIRSSVAPEGWIRAHTGDVVESERKSATHLLVHFCKEHDVSDTDADSSTGMMLGKHVWKICFILPKPSTDTPLSANAFNKRLPSTSGIATRSLNLVIIRTANVISWLSDICENSGKKVIKRPWTLIFMLETNKVLYNYTPMHDKIVYHLSAINNLGLGGFSFEQILPNI